VNLPGDVFTLTLNYGSGNIEGAIIGADTFRATSDNIPYRLFDKFSHKLLVELRSKQVIDEMGRTRLFFYGLVLKH